MIFCCFKILEWARHQLSKNNKLADSETEEYKTGFKEVLADILPFIRFPTMRVEYLKEVVGESEVL